MKMIRKYWFMVFVGILIATFALGLIVGISRNQQSATKRQYCVVYGHVTDYLTKQPVENVTIMFFVGDSKEIAYTNATYSANSDAKGFYIDIMPLYQGHEYPEVEAVKGGYIATPMYEAFPHSVMEYGYIEPMRYQFALYRADFQMIQLPNYTSPSTTKTRINMTSTVFSKLDGSYVFWDFSIVPDFMLTLGVTRISGGYGNNTQVSTEGFIPSRVDVTFFNGTDIAYTSYYPVLRYWTDPEIVKGTL
jgi:hypothetical protein